MLSRPFQKLFARDRTTKGIRFLTLVTLSYLLVEFAFSAWLIDVLGSLADEDSIRLAEHYGRLISGFAVALLLWAPILRVRSIVFRSVILALTTTCVMYGVYHGERALIDGIVESSSEQERAAAVTGSLLRAGLATGQIKDSMLEGLWNSETSRSNAGKAFVGISAFMAAGSDAARTQTLAIAPQVIRGVIDQQIGGLEAEYSRFLQSQELIKAKFKTYQDGHQQYRKALGDAQMMADRAWEKYLDRLEARHRYWGRWLIKHPNRNGQLVPGRAIKPTREAVRKQGIPVPDNWNTGDRATFIRLAKQEHVNAAQRIFKKRLGEIPADLSFTQFAGHSQVQRIWRESIHYPKNIGILPASKISKAQFKSRIYDSVLGARAKDRLAGYQSKVSEYADGGNKEEQGRHAYEVMIAPVFALTLSLIGAMVHLFKAGFLLIHVSTGIHFRSAIGKTAVIAAAVIGLLLVASSQVSTALTSHKTYQQWIMIDKEIDFFDLKSTQITLVSTALDAVIKAQSIAYPAFNVIRLQFEPITSSEAGRQVVSFIGNGKQ